MSIFKLILSRAVSFRRCLRRLLELEVVLEAVDGDMHHRRLVLDEGGDGELLRLVPSVHIPENLIFIFIKYLNTYDVTF